MSPTAPPGEKVLGDGHRETASREELEGLVDALMREVEQEEGEKCFDAYLAAHAEEAKATFVQTLRASSEKSGKKAQRRRDVQTPEAAEQAGDEQPGNAC